MRQSLGMKVLGAIVLFSELGALAFLLGLQFVIVYGAATNAKSLQDCGWMMLYAVFVPCLSQVSGFLPAVEEDFRIVRWE